MVASLAIAVACNDSVGPDGPSVFAACEPGADCDSLDAICLADDLRCQCMWTELGSHRAFCEPVICPEPAILGAACTVPGLECDYDGYDHTRCMGTDPVWMRCMSARFGAHCPAAPPVQGALCCVVSTGAPASCTFQDASVWECVADRWTQQP